MKRTIKLFFAKGTGIIITIFSSTLLTYFVSPNQLGIYSQILAISSIAAVFSHAGIELAYIGLIFKEGKLKNDLNLKDFISYAKKRKNIYGLILGLPFCIFMLFSTNAELKISFFTLISFFCYLFHRVNSIYLYLDISKGKILSTLNLDLIGTVLFSFSKIIVSIIFFGNPFLLLINYHIVNNLNLLIFTKYQSFSSISALNFTNILNKIKYVISSKRKDNLDHRVNKFESINVDNKVVNLIFITAISSFAIFKSDIIMLNYYVSDNDLGLYAFALRLTEIAVSLLSSLTISKASNIFDINSGNNYKKFLNTSVLQILFLGIFLSASFNIFISYAFELKLININYLMSKDILSLLLLTCIPQTFIYFFTVFLISNKRVLVVSIISVFSLFLNIVLNLILIPKYDLQGAAIATLLTYILYSLFIIERSYRYNMKLVKTKIM